MDFRIVYKPWFNEVDKTFNDKYYVQFYSTKSHFWLGIGDFYTKIEAEQFLEQRIKDWKEQVEAEERIRGETKTIFKTNITGL